MNTHTKMLSMLTARQSSKTVKLVYFFRLFLPPAAGEFCRTDVGSSMTLS